MAICRSVVCWKGLCSETTDLKLCTADRTQKTATLRSPHFVSVQLHLHHLHLWFKPDHFLSKLASWITLAWSQQAPDSMADRERRTVHKMAPLIKAWTLPPASHRLAHRQLLTVVNLLIDAATETHWKTPGTGPMTWTYALLFMHVVIPKCTLPHSYIQHHWNHSMVCAKNDLKPLDKYTEVVWLVKDCMK